MTNLKKLRMECRLRLREVAEAVGVTPAGVHDAEVRGLRSVRAARKYAVAFPGKTWQDLIDDIPTRTCAGEQ